MGALAEKMEHVDTVGEEARAALAKSGGEVQKAATFLAAKVRRSQTLRTAILEPLIEYACYQAVAAVSRKYRGTVWPLPAANPRLSDEQRVAALAADNLLMFPLPGGKPLGDASRSDISAASDFYGKQADDMSHKSRWLALVAQSIPDGKVAKDVMSSARLRELQQEARNV